MVIEATPDSDAAIRRRWGKNLAETMAAQDITPKRLVIEMAMLGVDINTSSISQWTKGVNAPGPSKMIALARVLRVPPRMLFSLDIEVIRQAEAA